jgi:hypothetical protein
MIFVRLYLNPLDFSFLQRVTGQQLHSHFLPRPEFMENINACPLVIAMIPIASKPLME